MDALRQQKTDTWRWFWGQPQQRPTMELVNHSQRLENTKIFPFAVWSNRSSYCLTGFPHSSAGRESACSTGDPSSIPRSGRSPWKRDRLPTPVFLGFPCDSACKESACNAGDLGSIPGLGRSPGEGKGYPLQNCGLENPLGCIVHGVTKCQTQLSDFHLLLKSIMMDPFVPSSNLGKINNEPVDWLWVSPGKMLKV